MLGEARLKAGGRRSARRAGAGRGGAGQGADAHRGLAAQGRPPGRAGPGRDGARRLSQGAGDRSPTSCRRITAIVTLLMQQGKIEEAGKQFEAMKKIAPKHPQTLYLQALLAYRDKDYAAAREAIQLHLKAAPDNLPGLLLGAQIDYQLESYAQAEARPRHGTAARPEATFGAPTAGPDLSAQGQARRRRSRR